MSEKISHSGPSPVLLYKEIKRKFRFPFDLDLNTDDLELLVEILAKELAEKKISGKGGGWIKIPQYAKTVSGLAPCDWI